MSISIADFTPDRYGPDHKLLEALVNDSEEEWMKILRERRNDIIGWPVCFLICFLKRWIATLQMLADVQRPFFAHIFSWEKSILYTYIRNNAFVASAERKWPKLPYADVALMAAISDGYTEGVKAILKFVRLPSPRDLADSSLLLEAVASGNAETVRALLDYGQKDYFVSGCNTTAAAQAAWLGELEMVQEIGWSVNDGLMLERGVRGGSMEVVKAIVAARTERFNLERISRLTRDESLRELLSEANAALPEEVPPTTASRWERFLAKPKQVNATSKKQVDAGTSREKDKWQ